ncbi:predicted transcriptional regulators [Lactococcus lactis subsp. lactis]|nr:helix-turn-helix domain-containing protein [Lactococcus lactis]KST83928.1 Phage repressor [Lactococcus lactis subsp. lactis]MBU3884358.1 helix-turn-helix domain-containing protein [Lactococcus lactis]MCT3121043.1 helix-turn-helix domain-containing protein [Lactococcus lactis]MDX6024940.1 helix-turn-helix domain-containing protein [Lactococcus lactis subsp. lactis]PCS15593.1 cI-like repressor [Lactococcus lactis subsp. lactis]
MEIEQINKYVGSKIKDYRKSFGLSQEELAKKIGVGKTTISNYEVGIRSPKKPQLIKLSEVFDVAIDDFFPQTDSTRINVSSTLSEINKISSQLEEPRQKVVLDTASSQLKEQEEQKSKIVSIKNEQEKFDLADLVDDSKVDWDKWVSFDGRPLTDEVKEAMKKALGKELEDK